MKLTTLSDFNGKFKLSIFLIPYLEAVFCLKTIFNLFFENLGKDYILIFTLTNGYPV